MTCATAALLLPRLVYCLLLRSIMGQVALSVQLLRTPKLQIVLCGTVDSQAVAAVWWL